MDLTHWQNIEYLKQGTLAQKSVLLLLKHHHILERLHKYDPILVGTLPIDIHVAGSDLDIICEVVDFEHFKRELQVLFGSYAGFTIARKIVDGIERIKANFICESWPVEIFGQSIPTREQNGLIHMVVEARLLDLFGGEFKRRIIRHKEKGLKTEPAFAHELHLQGNPYQEILKLTAYSDEELSRLWR